MAKAIGMLILSLFTWVSTEPYYFSAPYFPSRYAAALTAPPVAATIPAAPVPALPALPAVPASWNPVTSLSAYAYGSGYSVQELPLVNSPSASMIYSPYGTPFPLAYASDYFYRR